MGDDKIIPGGASDADRGEAAGKQRAEVDVDFQEPTNATVSARDVELQDLLFVYNEELDRSPGAHREAELSLGIARIHQQRGDIDQALASYKTASRLDKTLLPALRGERRILLENGDFKSALLVYEKELDVTNDKKLSAALLLEMAHLYEDRLNDKKSAFKHYQRAAELNPNALSILKSMQRCAESSGLKHELAHSLDVATNLLRTDSAHRAALQKYRADVAAADGNLDLAVELYTAALASDSSIYHALFSLQQLFSVTEDWGRLVGTIERAAVATSDNELQCLLHYQAAVVRFAKLNQPNEALDSLLKANQAISGEPLVLQELARIYQDSEMLVSLLSVSRIQLEKTKEASLRVPMLRNMGFLLDILGQPSEALEYLRSAVELAPTDQNSLGALALAYRRAKQWEELVSILHMQATGTSSTQKAAAIYCEVGDIYDCEIRDIRQAIDSYERALSLDSCHHGAFKALSRLYAQVGEHRQLVRLYESAAENASTDGERVSYLLKVGHLWEENLSDPTRAIAPYTQVFQIQPSNLLALRSLQRVQEICGQWRELAKSLQQEADLSTNEAKISALLSRIGVVHEQRLGEPSVSKQKYIEAIAIDRANQEARRGLKRIYHRNGDWREVLDLLEQDLEYVKSKEELASISTKMGELCINHLDDYETGVLYFKKAIEANPGKVNSYQPLLSAYRTQENWKELSKTLLKVLEVEKDPKRRASLLYRVGEISETYDGDTDKALNYYQISVKEYADYRPSVLALIRLQSRVQKWNELIASISKEISTTKDESRRVTLLLAQGETFANQLTNLESAAECFEKASESEAGNLSALLALESIYNRTGSWAALADVYARQTACFRDPKAQIAALHEQARIQSNNGLANPNEIIETYSVISDNDPRDLQALLQLDSRVRKDQDKPVHANVLRRLVDITHDKQSRADYLLDLAILREKTSPAQAIESFRAALDEVPSCLEAVRGIARVSEANDDFSNAAEACRTEAGLLTSPQRVSSLWYRSARLRSRAGESALHQFEDLEKSVCSWPEDDNAIETLIEAGRAAQLFDRCIDVLEQISRTTKSPERRCRIWIYVSDILRETKNDVNAAISSLQNAVAAHPSSFLALRRLSELFEITSQPRRAIEALENSTNSIEDSDRLGFNQDLARLYNQIGDVENALEYLGKALEIDKHNPEILQRRSLLLREAGRTDEALGDARKRLGTQTDPSERSTSLALVAQLEIEMGNKKAAVEALHEAVVLTGPVGDAADLYQAHAMQEGNWVGYAASLADHVKRASTGEIPYAGGRGATVAYSALANVYRDGMGLPHKAVETLGEGSAQDPNNRDLKFEWLTSLRKNGSPEQSLAEAWKCVEQYPSDPDYWDALKESYNVMDKPTESGLASQTAAILRGDAGPIRSKGAAFAPHSFSTDVIRSIAIDGALDKPATALLGVISDSLAQLYSIPLSKAGVTKPRRINKEESHPLYGICYTLSEAMNTQCDIYESSVAGPPCTVELTNPPCLVLSPAVRSLPRSSQAFIVGFGLAQLSTHTFSAIRMNSDELLLVLAAATKIVVPDFSAPPGSDPNVLSSLSQRIKRALPRKYRKNLETAATAYAISPLTDAAGWQNALHKTSLRAGALCSNDLLQIIDTTRQIDGLPPGQIRDTVAKSSLVAEMLRFWASTSAVKARRHLGLLGR